MVNDGGDIATVGQAIQLSVAPVFLLSAIGGMLSVMTNRVARIVDRARTVESRLEAAGPDDRKNLEGDLAVLSRRVKLIQRAITFCTLTAICVCTVVANLFLGAFFRFHSALPVAGLFVTAMAMFLAGLLFFLREIFLATSSLRIGR